jgi:trehalose 6-phosphate synthase/phosphatase
VGAESSSPFEVVPTARLSDMQNEGSQPNLVGRLMVVSNRAPFRIVHQAGRRRIEPTVGGLATTFLHLLEKHGGLWVAWSGGTETPNRLNVSEKNPPFSIVFIGLSERQISHYYWNMCNRGLWPLMHSMPFKCDFGPSDWDCYREVNQRFARSCSELLQGNDTVWIQDFHLALLPGLLRRAMADRPIGLFWHVPFPSGAILNQLPWRHELLRGMLGSDLIGFHTPAYASNFLDCCRDVLGLQIDRESGCVFHDVGTTKVGAYPIGVPVDYFQGLRTDPKVIRRLALITRTVNVERIILGVDRLDYTKGLPERLRGYERFLEQNPQYHKRVTLVQIAVPSRTRVPEYRSLRRQVEALVADIVTRFSVEGWLPIRYLYKQYDPQVLVAYYLAADVALITPLVDGMNLVAKEYVATHTRDDGVLILSEFAGAAVELKEALLVNPYNADQIAEQLKYALEIDEGERRRRMRALRTTVEESTLTRWSQTFLEALQAARKSAQARHESPS